MVLTKTDLSKIGQVVDKRLDKRLQPLEKTVKGIDNKLGSVEKGVKVIKKDVKRIKKDVSVMLDVFDRKNIKLGKRVSRVEKHLDLPPMPEHAFA